MKYLKYVVMVPMAGGAEMDLCECECPTTACAVVSALLCCGVGSPARVTIAVRECIDGGPGAVVTPPY